MCPAMPAVKRKLRAGSTMAALPFDAQRQPVRADFPQIRHPFVVGAAAS